MDTEKEHIVLVEDDEAHAELMVEALRAAGWSRIDLFSNIAATRRFLNDHTPDVLLVDLVLPDGRGTLLLPQPPEASRFPIILITSFGDETTAVEAMKAGAVDYITKSDQMFRDLPNLVARTIQQWQQVAARRDAEERLRHREEHLRLALDAANSATLEWQLESDEIIYSNGLEKLLGCAPRHFKNSHDAYLQRVHADDRMQVDKELTRAQQALNSCQQARYYVEHRAHCPGEPTRWLALQGRFASGPSGTCGAGTVLDITERKLAEEKLRTIEDRLAHVARVSTLGEMVSSLTHELNQPLYAIQNYGKACANLLAQRQEPAEAGMTEWLGQIVDTAEHAGQALARLRQFVRKTPSTRKIVDLKEIVDTAIGLVGHEACQKQIAIEHAGFQGDAMVFADPIQIQQVVVNLLRNAFEALEQWPNPDSRVTAATARHADVVEVSVTDNGPGLPSDQDAMFEPFNTTKQNAMGMGLAISRTIVEAHGGKFWATPNSPRGASFHLTLPWNSDVRR